MDKILSIIIPAANSERTIKRAIDSVTSGNVDDDSAIEIIVVLNNSTDNTFGVVTSLVNNFVKHPVIRLYSCDPGRSKARNFGLSLAKGQIGIFLDADDELSSDFINAILSMKNKIIGEHFLYFCEATHVFDNRAKEEVGIKLPATKNLYKENVFVIDSVAFKIDDVSKPFDESLEYCEDWKFWAQNFLYSKIVKLNLEGVKVHVTGDNSMKNSLMLLKSESIVRAQIHLENRKTSLIRDSKVILNFLSIDHSLSQEEILSSSFKFLFKFFKIVYNIKICRLVINFLFERKVKKSIY